MIIPILVAISFVMLVIITVVAKTCYTMGDRLGKLTERTDAVECLLNNHYQSLTNNVTDFKTELKTIREEIAKLHEAISSLVEEMRKEHPK